MSRTFIATRGAGNWRERLGNPETHWKQKCSALETAVSWECAARTESGLPLPVRALLQSGGYDNPNLLLAVAEHKVELHGGGGASQCDVWGIVGTSKGLMSVSVEAKGQEKFGDDALKDWFVSGKSPGSLKNRKQRWEHIRKYLPESNVYEQIRYQILHRCAAAVIEAERFGFLHASFVVQAFHAPKTSLDDFRLFCKAFKIDAEPGKLALTSVRGISLGVGWADCEFASDKEIASVV